MSQNHNDNHEKFQLYDEFLFHFLLLLFVLFESDFELFGFSKGCRVTVELVLNNNKNSNVRKWRK